MSRTLYQTDLRITNHRRQKISTVIYAPFNSCKPWIEWPLGWLQPQVFCQRVLFKLLQFSRQRQSFSAHRAAPMKKKLLDFPAFSSRFVDFAVQFCFCGKFSFHEKQRLSQVWQWHFFLDQSQFFATHSNQWNCFTLWAKASFRFMLKYFEINKSFMCSNLFHYYIKQIDSMLPCICSVKDHRRRQNVVTLCYRLVSYHILTSSVIYYWQDARQRGIYLLNIFFWTVWLQICICK